MSDLAIDYAWARPDPHAIRAAGYVAVLRYLSHDPSKDLTPDELHALHAAGLAVGVVWETVAETAASGAAGGQRDGAEVGRRLAGLGWPAGLPVWYAYDTDDRDHPGILDVIGQYLGAAQEASGWPAAIYGSVRAVQAAGDFRFSGGWQAEAWSGNEISAHAVLYQRVTHTLAPIPGVDPAAYDEDVILTPCGLWYPGQVPVESSAPPVVSAPAPIPPAHPGGFDVTGLPLLRQGSKGQAVRNLQGLLLAAARQVSIDGDFGPGTDRALRQWQTAAGLTSDGIAGNRTWGYLLGARVG